MFITQMVFLKGPHILIGIILNYGEYHCVLERSHVLICLVSMVQIFGLWCWLVWKERNRCTFEDMESSLDQLKTLFARTLLIGPGFGVSHSVLLF